MVHNSFLGYCYNLVICSVFITEFNIVLNRIRKQESILGYKTYTVAKVVKVYLFNIFSVNGYFAFLNII